MQYAALNTLSIAQVTSRTGWYSNTGDFSNRRSSPLNLTEGQHYLIVGDLAEGYGGDYLRVSKFNLNIIIYSHHSFPNTK